MTTSSLQIENFHPPVIDFDNNRCTIDSGNVSPGAYIAPTIGEVATAFDFTLYEGPLTVICDDRVAFGSSLYEQRMSYQERRAMSAMVAAGEMPTLDNGFSFVIDRRPSGQEDQLIPPDDYTRYFANRQLPISDVDHAQHSHDVGHMPSYRRLFVHAEFADTVALAATNAIRLLDAEGSPDLCRRFTGAIDHLGDVMRNLQEGNYRIGYVNGALRRIQELVTLARPDQSVTANQALFDVICEKLSLPFYRNAAKELEPEYRHHHDILPDAPIHIAPLPTH